MGRHCARSNCPFCGWEFTNMKTKKGFVMGKGNNADLFYVQCCSAFCEATGPVREKKHLAASAWNARATRRDRHGNVEGGEGLDFEDMLR